MSTNKQALREAAEKANELNPAIGLKEFARRTVDYHALANPAIVMALLDELEAADNRINRLESIVAVAEKRNALMREWKRALKVPCDLVDDQVPVVIHGMVVRLDRLKETEEKLAAAEKRIEVLAARVEFLEGANG